MTDHIIEIQLEQIKPNPEQPRKRFDEQKLKELAQSIEEVGLVDPISVEATDDPQVFVLEDGERRLRAHKLAGKKTILAIVSPMRQTTGGGRLSRALVANLQRADMNPVEEGQAYARLKNEFGWSYKKISRATGASDPLIQNRILISNLDPEIQELIIDGKFPKDTRAVEAIFSITDRGARIETARVCAVRRYKVKTIVATCVRLKEVMETGPGDDPDAPPSFRYAEKRVGDKLSPIYGQLMKRQALPSYETVKTAAKKACARCPWNENPSADICGQCPAVDLVTFMVTPDYDCP